MNGRVEEPAGSLARLDRSAHHLDQGARADDAAVAIQPRELRVGTKPRHRLLEQLELPLDRVRPFSQAAMHHELDLGAHRVKDVRLHHDVRVVVSGGSVTTRTGGATVA